MAKSYRTTGSIATVNGQREEVKMVDRNRNLTELFAIESMNGSVMMPSAAELAAADESRKYDATFISAEDAADFDDDDDITEEDIERTIREALAK